MLFLKLFCFREIFRQKELKRFYLTVFLMGFSEFLINIFVPIYFYKLGYPIYLIIFFYFLTSLSFVVFSYFGAKIVSIIGTKRSILLSVLFLILYYCGLLLIPNYSWVFFILPIVLCWRMILYDYGYHLHYLTHSKKSFFGKEISFFSIIGVISGILAPIIGGLVASFLGFSILYLLGSILLVISTVPLFLSKEKHEKLKFNKSDLWKGIFSKKDKGSLISFSGYAIESSVGRNIWPIFLIIMLVDVYKTGLIIALSTFVSIILLYLIGKITDKYDRMRLLKIGTILYFFGWIFRIFVNNALQVLVVDSYKQVSQKILQIPWAAKSYELALKRGYFRFLVGREIVFKLSRVIILPFLMLIFYLDFYPFIISFMIAAIFSLGYLCLNEK